MKKKSLKDVFPRSQGYAHLEDELPDLPAVWNALNVRRRSLANEVGGGISQTVPDQAMSVREILSRFAQGLPISGASVPMYDDPDGENDDAEGMPDLSRMDLSEIEELKRQTQDRINLLSKKLKDEELSRNAPTAARAADQPDPNSVS